MADHPPAPITQIKEDIGEDFPLNYDEQLAERLYADNSSQNRAVIEIFLALAGAGIGYGVEVRDAYALLAKSIDPHKLVTDHKYKKQVERAMKLVKRHEGNKLKTGTSKYSEVIPQTQKAIERTDATLSKLLTEKSSMLLNDNLYLRRLQSAYNLDDKQLQALTYSAWEKIRENPSLSIKDALRIEAENFSLRQATKKVENENKGKNLTKEEKKALVEKKLTEKHIAYETSLKTTDAKTGEVKSYADYENKRINALINTQVEENKQILTARFQPQSTPSPQPAVLQSATPTISPASSPKGFSLPHISFPSIPKVSFGGLGGELKSVFGSGGLLSKAGSSLAGMAGGALPKLASFALPPLGAALTALSAIDTLTGGMGSKLIGIVIIVAVSLPIIMILFLSSNTFSSNTASNPTMLRVSVKNNNTISWAEFEKNFLTLEKSNKKDLSLNPDRHDDVQK